MGEREFQGLKVIDFHSHFQIGQDSTIRRKEPEYQPGTPAYEAVEFRKAQVARYQDQWRLAWDFPKPDMTPRPWEEEADEWVDELEKYGIARIGFVTGGGNDQLGEVIARHPDDFIGFAHHEPFGEDAAKELERAVTQLEMRGYKMLAPTLSKRIDDKSACPAWEVAAKHGIPVLIHFGMQGAAGGIAFNDKINPAYLESVARDFPTVNFVVPHFGIQFVKELLIPRFQEQNPMITVKHVTHPYDAFRQQVQAAVQAGQGPDVLNVFYGWAPAYYLADFLKPMPEAVFPTATVEEEFFPMLSSVRFEDQYYAIPTAVRTLGLFWNQDLARRGRLRRATHHLGRAAGDSYRHHGTR